MRAFRFLFAITLLVAATVAFAGETGSISGRVTDTAGGALPGVTVKVAGPQLPAGRTFLTGTNGAYNFQRLLPGSYTVEASLAGLGKASRTVSVQVDRDYQVELVLKGDTTAAVEVVATSVDARSSEVASNFATEEIRQLPLSRSYEGLLSLVPGAPATSGNGYVAIAGGTRQENKYLVDGVNITNPGYGYLGIDTNELDIADVSVKTGAISAEFGRTSGAIVNAVTKSGTNDFHGNLRFEARPASFQGDNKHATQSDVDTYTGSGGVGFPIVKDVLFGYVSARYSDTKTSGQTALQKDGTTTTQPDTKQKNTDYFGKLTGYLGEKFLVSAGFRGLPYKTTDAFDSSYDNPSAAWNGDGTHYVGNLSVNWFATKDTFAELKYVHSTEDDSYGAATILTDRPMTLDPTKLWQYGAFTDSAKRLGNQGVYQFADGGEVYKRDEIKLTASQFLDIGATQHQIKVGGGAEFDAHDLQRISNGWGLIANNVSLSGTPAIRARYYGTQPQQLGRARTYSIFVQDTITWKRLSATLGVLANRDDFAQVCNAGIVCSNVTGALPLTEEVRYNFMTFSWDQQIQPRIGLVYASDLLQGDKFYANYGEYAGTDQKSTSRSFAPYRARYDQAFWNRATGEYITTQVIGSSTGKLIPPDLEPPVQQEWIVGYSAPVSKDLAFDVTYQYKNLKHPFEDTPINPDSYFGSFQAKNFPNARRVYRGYTLDVTKRYADKWYANLSYTYSKLEGNWDEDASAGVFNTSSILEDEPGTNSAEPNRYGRLRQDRPHILKVMASYDLYGFTLGTFFRLQSGTPWEARGNSPSGPNRYLEAAGSRRLPDWKTLDLLLAYNFALGGDMSIRLEGRVQNVFDEQTTLSVDTLQYNDSYKDGTPARNLGPQGTSSPNANFGNATSWASPRRFVLTALFNF